MFGIFKDFTNPSSFFSIGVIGAIANVKKRLPKKNDLLFIKNNYTAKLLLGNGF